MKNEWVIPELGPRFSIYRLAPDRRFVAGRNTLEEAVILARTVNGKADLEIWDNRIQRQCYINHFGKERFARGYQDTATTTAR